MTGVENRDDQEPAIAKHGLRKRAVWLRELR